MIKTLFRAATLLVIIVAWRFQTPSITVLQTGKPTSIRGMSVADDEVAWVSGSKGYVGQTLDGGQTWRWLQVAGFEKSDFRAIYAFSAKQALIMSSGTPAVILKTIDGGATWKVKYQTADTAYFFDAMDFDSEKHGMVLGDPIKNKFVLMETTDGGENWLPYKNPPAAMAGEAAFAASGTCLKLVRGNIGIVTGGAIARFINYNVTLGAWEYDSLPIVHHKSSQGAFSFVIGKNLLLFVGGDYAKDKKVDSAAAYAEQGLDALFVYHPIKMGPTGYQSCVEFITGQTYLSTGTPGSNITTDGGKSWKKIDGTSYNVCRKAKNGKLVLLAGNNGAIGLFKL